MQTGLIPVTAAGWLVSVDDAAPSLRFGTGVPDDSRAAEHRLQRAALALTLLLHVGFWALVNSSPMREPPAGAPPLDVVFIESVPTAWPVPPMPQPPPRPAPARATAAPGPPRDAPARDASSAATAPVPRPLRLHDADARPLLPSQATATDSYIAPQSRAVDLRSLGSRPRLPGRAEPVVDIGEIPQSLSPQQIVGLLGRVFGAPQPDSCDKVERRLIDETDPLAKQITMDTFNKRCRCWR